MQLDVDWFDISKASLGGGLAPQVLLSHTLQEIIDLHVGLEHTSYLQARRSALAAKLGKKVSKDISKPDSEVTLTTGLRDSRDIEMALMVRASRNLPILLLAKEYERILRRRL